MMLFGSKVVGFPTGGGVRYDKGSAAKGMLSAGQVAEAVHVTVPPGPLFAQFPEMPKVLALTFSAFPLVLKSPLSTIPQVGAFRVALPLMLTPSMLFAGGPNA